MIDCLHWYPAGVASFRHSTGTNNSALIRNTAYIFLKPTIHLSSTVYALNVRPGDISLDIGAHVGIYALCLAEWSAPSGRVFAFEPNPNTQLVLEKHIALNNFAKQIEVIRKAVSNAPCETTFFALDFEGSSRLGQANPDLSGEVKAAPVTVPVTSVDVFVPDEAYFSIGL